MYAPVVSNTSCGRYSLGSLLRAAFLGVIDVDSGGAPESPRSRGAFLRASPPSLDIHDGCIVTGVRSP
jgi:hypothetical protein